MYLKRLSPHGHMEERENNGTKDVPPTCVGETAPHAGKRHEGYIPPPTVSFTEIPPPDDLVMPMFTTIQMDAARVLTAAIGQAPSKYDSVWRGIPGAHMDALLLLCTNLKSPVLAFRAAWYSVDEKTLNPDRLRFLEGIVRPSDLNYARTAAYGEREGGGSAASSADPQAHMVEPPPKKLRDLGEESWNQFWTGRVVRGRGLFFSADAIRRTGVTGLSPPQTASTSSTTKRAAPCT